MHGKNVQTCTMTVGRIWSCVLMLKPINSIQISDSYKLYQEPTLYCKRNKSLSNISSGRGWGTQQSFIWGGLHQVQTLTLLSIIKLRAGYPFHIYSSKHCILFNYCKYMHSLFIINQPLKRQSFCVFFTAMKCIL